MIARAARLGHRAAAITDANSLSGVTVFDREARRAGLVPLIGAELVAGSARLLGLVDSRTGYENLCRLITRIHCLDSPLYPRPDTARQSPLPRALASLPDCSRGIHWIVEDADLARTLLQLDIDPNRLWLGIDPPAQRATTLRDLANLAETTGLRPVALGKALLAEPDDLLTARILAAIKAGTALENVSPRDLPHPQALLRTPEQIAASLEHWPRAIKNNRLLAQHCGQFTLIPDAPVFPHVCDSQHQAAQRLEQLCREGLTRRYPLGAPGGAEQRLRRELDLIGKLGFCEYFLVVWDIVQFARRKHVPVSGRGSGASSLAAYLLGITNVCPITYDIPFERFLHEKREDFPDLDIDFCWRIRDDVIDYAFRRWGRDHTAMVSSHNCFQPRSALRETAKTLGLSDAAISKALQTGKIEDPRLGRAAQLSPRLHNLPHLLSVHPGGIVITPGPIDRHAPLQPSAKGVLITQFDKDGVEDIRLVKLDLLGNRNLSTVRAACDLIARRRSVCIDIEQIPPADPATIEVLRRADTVGCNQLESPAMRHLLLMMRPQDVRDVMKTLALIRPGAASVGMKEVFIRRHRGLEPVPPQPAPVDNILTDTYGLMLYEDDVMLVGAAMLGQDLSEADRFRKAVQKCPDDEHRIALSRDFLSRCTGNGFDREYAKNIWTQMAKFNAYSFCRAHAGSYAILAYAGAYLKTHFPTEFWTACLNNNQSMYHPRVYVEQAKRDGLTFFLPDINRSDQEFTAERAGIRIGLDRVEGLGPTAVGRILRMRRQGPYQGITDFLLRTRLGENETRSLILCGAFDSFGRNRPTQMMELKLFAKVRPPRDATGPALLWAQPSIPNIPGDYDQARKYMDERRILGITPRRHIMKWFRPILAGGLDTDSRDLPSRVGRRVRIAGVLEARRLTRTASGNHQMLFLTLDDEWGLFEVTLFPALADKLSRQINRYGPYIITGRVQDQYGSICVTAQEVETRDMRPQPPGQRRQKSTTDQSTAPA